MQFAIQESLRKFRSNFKGNTENRVPQIHTYNFIDNI